MTPTNGTIKVRVTLIATVDVAQWRAEYGHETLAHIREDVASSLDDAARQNWPSAVFGTMVRVRTAER